MEHGPFTWFSLIPGLRNLPPHTAGSIVVALFLIVSSLLAFRRLRSVEEAIIPSDRLSITNLLELIVETTLSLLNDIIGHEGKRYLPLIGSLAFYILFSNLLGLIPGFTPPTGNLSTNFACALVVFFFYHYYGFRSNGIGYIKHFLGPLLPLAVIMFPVELISNLARPITLTVRLFANMTADHMVLEQALKVFLVIPVLAMMLGLFVCVVQTLIFCLLSTIYIALAVEETEHH
uniref:F-type H+-transporting ATPase subunit a n=1 Tax=uncultured prokaryote TaxID=198431 RepID=H5SPA4_9ZZZZ|nr:F-type H+-transporting ATPase subunit a [uncultured prokaryote]